MIVDFTAAGSGPRWRILKLKGQLDGHGEAFEIRALGPRLWRVEPVKRWDYAGELAEATVR